MNELNILPRQKLCEIIKVYGKEVCNDRKRIRGLLNDYCGGNYPEINFLVTALEEQLYTELVTSSNAVPYEMLSARLIKRLYINRGMAEEIAHWTVDSWALALGLISNDTPYTKPPVSFNIPQSGIVIAAKIYPNTIAQQTIVVSTSGGQFTTIGAAIRNASPDTLILVKPGNYNEGLVIDKRIKIKGDGPREQIIVESKSASCIQMQTDDEALVQGLTLRCCATFTNRKKHAVDIPMGRLKLIECDITSDTLAAVAIRGLSTRPEIQGCRLHDAMGSGLFIEMNAQGIIENCEIFRNAYPNISIMNYAAPVVRKCKIYDGKNHGVLVSKNGSGTIEDCDISGNSYDGVKAKEGGTPIVARCRIYGNNHQEEWVYQNGMGNMRYPTTKSPGIRHQRGYPDTHGEAISSNIYHTTENSAPQAGRPRAQEVVLQAEKSPNLIDRFVHFFRFGKEK